MRRKEHKKFIDGDLNSTGQIISKLPKEEWLLLSEETREFINEVEIERENKNLLHKSLTFAVDLELSDETGIAGTTWGKLKYSAMLIEYQHPPLWFVSVFVWINFVYSKT